jgi:protein-tyrosine-phosphatase
VFREFGTEPVCGSADEPAWRGKFRAFSAGTQPASSPHPLTLRVLNDQGFSTESLKSKHLQNFRHPDAPQMDFIFTLCDRMAGEGCPVFPGSPITAHWGFRDPALAAGTDTEKYHAFVEVEKQIATRIRLFLSLPLDKIDRLSLQKQLQAMGNTGSDEH